MVGCMTEKLTGRVLCAATRAIAALVSCLLVATSADASPRPINANLLAEFTFRVSRYTSWSEEKERYHLHAVGLTAAQETALNQLTNRRLKEKPIIVTFDDEVSLSDEDLPEIVVISGSFSIDPSEWCFTGSPILVIIITTPTESRLPFCKSSIISVDFNRGRIEFDANLTHAQRTGLELSARMLRLAREVR